MNRKMIAKALLKAARMVLSYSADDLMKDFNNDFSKGHLGGFYAGYSIDTKDIKNYLSQFKKPGFMNKFKRMFKGDGNEIEELLDEITENGNLVKQCISKFSALWNKYQDDIYGNNSAVKGIVDIRSFNWRYLVDYIKKKQNGEDTSSFGSDRDMYSYIMSCYDQLRNCVMINKKYADDLEKEVKPIIDKLEKNSEEAKKKYKIDDFLFKKAFSWISVFRGVMNMDIKTHRDEISDPDLTFSGAVKNAMEQLTPYVQWLGNF